MVTVRLFVTDPASGDYVTRLLQSQPDFRIVADDAFQVAVFAGEGAWLVALRTTPAARKPELGAIVITAHTRADDCAEWLAHGVFGIVAADRGEEELAPAVRRVAAGRLWLAAEVFRKWVTIQLQWAQAERESLTPREEEVRLLLVAGLSKKEIGNRLRISENTVKFHAKNIFIKEKVRSRRQLIIRSEIPTLQPTLQNS